MNYLCCSMSDLREANKNLGLKLTPIDMEEMFKEVNCDGNQSCNFEGKEENIFMIN